MRVRICTSHGGLAVAEVTLLDDSKKCIDEICARWVSDLEELTGLVNSWIPVGWEAAKAEILDAGDTCEAAAFCSHNLVLCPLFPFPLGRDSPPVPSFKASPAKRCYQFCGPVFPLTRLA